MARIFYGVQGDSNGHISRALTVAELLQGHEILFAGGGAVVRAREHGYAHEPLPLLATLSRNNKVDLLATARVCGSAICGRSKWIRRLSEIITAFDPALIITDYEYFTPLAAKQNGRMSVSLDHQHVITRTVYEPPPGQRISRLLTEMAIEFVIGNASRFLMSSFHHPPVRDSRRDELFGTLTRSDVLSLRPEQGEHAVVYVRGGDLNKIRNLFQGRKREYRIYGFGKVQEQKNLRFRDLSREGFLKDLASCAYVVSNGGHGLLSESLHLCKPTLCFPTLLAYEQYWNGIHIQRNGYGACHMRLDISPEAVGTFESRLERFRKNIAVHDFCGREALRVRLENLLQRS
ncbi:MAG TPA: glycosyltransferase family protein [Desulfobacterales bacterium]|nr:glycosyltransferase family protein [Desulfobacterales bacterium]